MSWPCPWQVVTECRRRGMKPCEPGAEGCVLAGRFDFPLKRKEKNGLRSSVAERGKTARARRGKADSR